MYSLERCRDFMGKEFLNSCYKIYLMQTALKEKCLKLNTSVRDTSRRKILGSINKGTDGEIILPSVKKQLNSQQEN